MIYVKNAGKMYPAPMLIILYVTSLLCSVSHGYPVARRPVPYGKCVPISKCVPVMRLIDSYQIRNVFMELNRQICGFEDNQPKIICRLPKFYRHLSTPLKPRPTTTTTTMTTTTTTTTTTTSRTPRKNPFEDPRLDHDDCGPVPMSTRIFGGKVTRVSEFPWMALLAYQEFPGIKGHAASQQQHLDFKCAATIVNKHYVMTAAHCVTNLHEINLKLVGVRVGEHDLTKDRDCEVLESSDSDDYNYDDRSVVCAERHLDFAIDRVHVHPNYSAVTLQNDIALVRINGTFTYSPSVRPVCLPLDRSSQRLGKSATVVGWGATKDYATSISPVLRKVHLPVLPIRACQLSYRDQPFVKLNDKQLCAGGTSDKDSCNGDSGGPLQTVVLYNGSIRTVQHGIVSFGRRNCAVKGSPAIYTKVVEFVDWILEMVDQA